MTFQKQLLFYSRCPHQKSFKFHQDNASVYIAIYIGLISSQSCRLHRLVCMFTAHKLYGESLEYPFMRDLWEWNQIQQYSQSEASQHYNLNLN